MPEYVAFLRGISPLNPNMRNDKLRGVFESLGFANVRTVISSGNVLFESPSKNIKSLETAIEKAIVGQLGFSSTTIIRRRAELENLAARNPFKGMEHTAKSSLNVTFLKHQPDAKPPLPRHIENRDYEILGLYDRAVCSVIDLTSSKTPDLMLWLEKQLGKEITTRTWKTITRILNGFHAGKG